MEKHNSRRSKIGLKYFLKDSVELVPCRIRRNREVQLTVTVIHCHRQKIRKTRYSSDYLTYSSMPVWPVRPILEFLTDNNQLLQTTSVVTVAELLWIFSMSVSFSLRTTTLDFVRSAYLRRATKRRTELALFRVRH